MFELDLNKGEITAKGFIIFSTAFSDTSMSHLFDGAPQEVYFIAFEDYNPGLSLEENFVLLIKKKSLDIQEVQFDFLRFGISDLGKKLLSLKSLTLTPTENKRYFVCLKAFYGSLTWNQSIQKELSGYDGGIDLDDSICSQQLQTKISFSFQDDDYNFETSYFQKLKYLVGFSVLQGESQKIFKMDLNRIFKN